MDLDGATIREGPADNLDAPSLGHIADDLAEGAVRVRL